jgi:hippurate hydrolase
MIKEQILALSESLNAELISTRNHLHSHPELSFQEYNTANYIKQRLDEMAISFTEIAGTGVLAVVTGKDPSSRTVALRADIDALPIIEENNVPYKSTQHGVMHACGHDVHTTCLLGAARILVETRNAWQGTVKLLFQPGEERDPGGASIMIKEGALENPKPERIFALHVDPRLEVGKLSFLKGMAMASCDEIAITIKVKGGHAAAPHLSADPIAIAAQIIVTLQQIISRQNDPFNPSVLTFGAIHGGTVSNVIPNEVKIMGTFRAMNEEWRFKAHRLVTAQTTAIANSLGAEVEINIGVGYPFVRNDEQVTTVAKQLAEDYLGTSSIVDGAPRMGAEDFAYYTHVVPGCFFRLGTGNESRGITSNIHTSTFDIDDRALAIGAGMMSYLGAVG